MTYKVELAILLISIVLILIFKTLPTLFRNTQKKRPSPLALNLATAACADGYRDNTDPVTPPLDCNGLLLQDKIILPVTANLTLPRKATKTSHIKFANTLLVLIAPPSKNHLLPEVAQINLALAQLMNHRSLPGNEYLNHLLKRAAHPSTPRAGTIQYVDAARSYLTFILDSPDEAINSVIDIVKVFVRRMIAVRESLERTYASVEYKRRELKIVRRDPRFRSIFEIPTISNSWKSAEAMFINAEDEVLAAQSAIKVLGTIVKTAKQVTLVHRKETGDYVLAHRRSRSHGDIIQPVTPI